MRLGGHFTPVPPPVGGDKIALYIFPISGPQLCFQAAALYHFLAAAEALGAATPPLAALGSSGGAVCCLLGRAAGWESARIPPLLARYNGRDLFKPASRLPAVVNAALTGAAARPTDRAVPLVSALVAEGEAGGEMIVGTFSQSSNELRLFSSAAPGAGLFGEYVAEYCAAGPGEAGEAGRGRFARAVIASASIPYATPAVRIGGREYSDGGTAAPSPWTGVWAPALAGELRVVYFTPEIPAAEGPLAPLASLINASARREIQDLLGHFRVKSGAGLIRTEYPELAQGVAAMRDKPGDFLLIIQPRGTQRYEIPTYGFEGRRLAELIMGHQDYLVEAYEPG